MELALNCGEHGLKLLILFLEVRYRLCLFYQVLVHLNQIVIYPNLLRELSPETCKHQQALKILIEPLRCKLLIYSIFELPEILLSDTVGLVNALLEDEVYEGIEIGFEAHQGLGYLVAIQNKLVV